MPVSNESRNAASTLHPTHAVVFAFQRRGRFWQLGSVHCQNRPLLTRQFRTAGSAPLLHNNMYNFLPLPSLFTV